MSTFPWLDFSIGVVLLALSPLGLGCYGGLVAADAILETRKRRKAKGIFWGLALIGVIAAIGFQYRAAKSDENHANQGNSDRRTWAQYHQEDLQKLQKLSQPGGFTPQNLADAWGKLSSFPVLPPPHQHEAVKGAFQPTQNPGKRSLNAESLARLVRASETLATATVINDGTVEAGTFAKQLEIGLRMAGWTVGGDNIKQGDPDFFPDALTIEVSSTSASATDKSAQDANALIAILAKLHVKATLRFTTLSFPSDFVRIEVAGQ